MNQVEKIFALKRHPLFSSLEDAELILIADVAVSRQFAPGSTIAEPGALLNRIYVVTGGTISGAGDDSVDLPLVGVESLVLEKPVAQTLVAHPEDGAQCLVIGKGHFFTILNECPEILIHYLEGTRRRHHPKPTTPSSTS